VLLASALAALFSGLGLQLLLAGDLGRANGAVVQYQLPYTGSGTLGTPNDAVAGKKARLGLM
jgi:hypothetical protein